MLRTTRFSGVLVLIVGSVFSTWLHAAEKEELGGKLIDCGADKVALFDQPLSPDGRYAIGWTLRANKPDAKPVDWSKWDPESDFASQYDFLEPEIVGSGMAPLVDAAKSLPKPPADWKSSTPYTLVDCVVDLREKKLLTLPSLWPYWPHKNHGSLSVTWDDDRAAIVNEARFFTADVWLVNASNAGLQKLDLLPTLNKTVADILKEKRPLSCGAYGISWRPNSESGRKIIFSKSTVCLPFSANIPKSDYQPVDGSITVEVGTGKVVKTECDTKRDDPFLDNPDLAKAEAGLNKAYKTLLDKLGKGAGEALIKEQAEWRAGRDYISSLDANSCLSAGVIAFRGNHISSVPDRDEEDLAKFTKKRDESLIESAKKRTEELKKRLPAK
jgi:uncharacterized protein YecT (DUF1311 family)